MKLCRFILTPVSPWASWLRSDTLNGLICWHVAENEGEAVCKSLIEAFGANEPPFALSSAMPLNTLPMPALPPISRQAFRQLAATLGEKGDAEDITLFKALQRFKKFRKRPWLPLDVWLKHRRQLSTRALFLDPNASDAVSKGEMLDFEPHVSIDRQTGTASEGQLFFMRLRYFDPSVRLHLYARAENPEYLHKYLRLIGQVGFGRDASTGNGQFTVELDGAFQDDTLELADANAQLLCSTCASEAMNSTAGYYTLEVKRGKMGPGHANPFKKPFLMLKEGSLLTQTPSGPYVLRDINADAKAVQILQPFCLPCHLQLPEEN